MTKTNTLPRCTPEEQGVSSSCIRGFLEEIAERKLELHGFMLLRHGHVIAEGWWKPYRPDAPHLVYSLTKSFISIAAGFGIQEGLISVDDDVLPFFPEMTTPEIRENMRDLKIKHLLTMTTGHETDTTRFIVTSDFLEHRSDLRIGDREDHDDVRGFLELPIQHAPGTHFVYNSGASLVLGAILERRAGVRLADYLQPRLFGPLGILKPQWDRTPYGGNTGGWGIRLTTEEIARFGQFLLNKGVWNGERLLSSSWIEEATAYQVANKPVKSQNGVRNADWEQGYGYQFWRCRHGAYRGDGAFGQYCLVMPDQDAVIAINGGLMDMQAVLDAVWDHLLPGIKERALPKDPSANDQLIRRLTSLELGPSSVKERMGGSFGSKRFEIENNTKGLRSVSLAFAGDGCRFEWRDVAGTHGMDFGLKDWRETRALGGKTVAAKGTWRDAETFVLTAYEMGSPHHDIITFEFKEKAVKIRHGHLSFVAVNHEFTGTAVDE